jgi:hypothetical protein
MAKRKQLKNPMRGAMPTPRNLLAGAAKYVGESGEATGVPQTPQADVAPQSQLRAETTTTTRRRAMARKKKGKGLRAPMRGAIPTPRHLLASATPYSVTIGAPPTHIVIPKKLSMWGNDVHGDCVTAEEAFAKACHSPDIFITDKIVEAWAQKHGVLEGANLNEVLQWMRTDGFVQGGHTYDDGPFYSLDWTNSGTLSSAIAQGPVKIGVAADQLETAWRTTNGKSGWFATGFHDDANEDHCVSLCGYGSLQWLARQLKGKVPAGVDGSKPGYAMFTWDSIGIIDQPSMIAITHEAWLRNPTTVIK